MMIYYTNLPAEHNSDNRVDQIRTLASRVRETVSSE